MRIREIWSVCEGPGAAAGDRAAAVLRLAAAASEELSCCVLLVFLIYFFQIYLFLILFLCDACFCLCDDCQS